MAEQKTVDSKLSLSSATVPNKRQRSLDKETWEMAYAFIQSYSSPAMHSFDVYFVDTTDPEEIDDHYVHISMWDEYVVCCLQTDNTLTAFQVPVREVRRAQKDCQMLLDGQTFSKIFVEVPSAPPIIREEHVFSWTCGTKFLSEIQTNVGS